MTYSHTTPILGSGSVSAEAIQAYFVHRGPGYAPAYAPDKAYKAPPAGLGRAIVDECRRYPQAIVNHDIVAAQVMVETAAWQSKYARDRNNPGGIGAINSNPDLAITFPTVAAGVRAHVAHLLVYALGDGPWSADDPRRDAVAKAGWLGTAPTWGGLNGKWAYPGTTYGQSITNLANALRDFANNGTWTQEPTMPTTIPKPPMVSRPSPNRGGYDPDEDGPRVAEAITYHIATSTISSNLGWLTNPASGASCNYYIGKDGTIYELVPWQEAAWTNGKVSKPDTSNALIAKWVRNGWNPNTRTISIEHEGEARDTLTAAQIASNNRLTAWLSQVAGIPISRTTIIGHYQIDSVDRPYCPSFSDAEWRALVDGANALLNVSQPQPEPAPTPEQETITLNGHTITGGILQAWRKAGGTDASLAGPGLPTSDEIRGAEAERYGATAIQWFERDRAEWKPGRWADNYDVEWGLVANELRDLWRELEAA